MKPGGTFGGCDMELGSVEGRGLCPAEARAQHSAGAGETGQSLLWVLWECC